MFLKKSRPPPTRSLQPLIFHSNFQSFKTQSLNQKRIRKESFDQNFDIKHSWRQVQIGSAAISDSDDPSFATANEKEADHQPPSYKGFSLVFCGFEVGFGCAAKWACPVIRQVFESCASSNAVFRIADCGIVFVSAKCANVFHNESPLIRKDQFRKRLCNSTGYFRISLSPILPNCGQLMSQIDGVFDTRCAIDVKIVGLKIGC